MFMQRQPPGSNNKLSTIEHIVPQSRLRRCGYAPAVGDMHNFLVYPARLNQARGVSRMVDEAHVLASWLAPRALDEAGHEVPAPWTPCVLRDRVVAWVGDGGAAFVPPRRLRGRIARAVAYMRAEYPRLQELEPDAELAPDLLLAWHLQHPACKEERAQERWVASVQGVANPFVRRPSLLLRTGRSRW